MLICYGCLKNLIMFFICRNLGKVCLLKSEIFFVITDTSNSGADAMFPMMKPVPGGGMPGVSVLNLSTKMSINNTHTHRYGDRTTRI